MSPDALQQFLAACGAERLLEVEVVEPGKLHPTRRRLETPFVLLGRDRRCAVCMDHPDVSACHLYVQFIAGRPFAIDLSSQSGALTGRWLTPSDVIRYGLYSFRMLLGNGALPRGRPSNLEPWSPLESGSADLFSLPTVTMEFSGSWQAATRLHMNRILTLVGRARACQFQLDDANVSPVHCALLLTPRGPCIIDLLGHDGIRMEGQPVPWAWIADGARLQIGRFDLRAWYQVPVRPNTTDLYFQMVSLGQDSITTVPSMPERAATVQEGLGATLPPFSPGVNQTKNSEAYPSPAGDPSEAMHGQMLGEFEQNMLTMAHMLNSMDVDYPESLDKYQDPGEGPQAQVRELQAEALQPSSLPSPPESKTVAGTEHATVNAPDEVKPQQPLAEPAVAIALTPETSKAVDPSRGAELSPIKANAEVHAWFHDRIQSLQKKRQGLLQRILSAITGK